MLDSLREVAEYLLLGVFLLACAAIGMFLVFVTTDFASAWFRTKRYIQDNVTEKRRRIYYQDIVYRVCNVLDKTGMFPDKAVCGTLEIPSTQVEARVTSLHRGYREMTKALNALTNEVQSVDLCIRENIAKEIERQKWKPGVAGADDAFVRDICKMIRDPQKNWFKV